VALWRAERCEQPDVDRPAAGLEPLPLLISRFQKSPRLARTFCRYRNTADTRSTPMAAQRFTDSFIDEDPHRAVQELNDALQEDPDNAEWFCQRAYAHILLKNYSCKSADYAY
ncbi:protein SGT1 homolog, partial [Plectropomus leopardus]|uniref:protein SGT1 homolog n=1 Tax=Plectropomus leopardus TaxID=160734 RepID=UPI001C4D5BAE